MTQIKTDYLIIGAGAVGMAFADVLLSETQATVTIIDKHDKPGGHWNDAYPFVTLHQPSKFYGVNSVELSSGRKDALGLNQGMHELASGAEVMAYYDQVMKHVFLPSGRVKYYPMCEYNGDRTFTSIVSGEKFSVDVKNKIVDGTYFKTSVPSTHTPNYSIADGVELIPLNELPSQNSPRDHYVVIGGGKTGIDACLWLLNNRIDPSKITWIMPRDAWWIDRKNAQPGEEFFMSSMGAQLKQMEAIATAASMNDLFDKLEAAGVLFRLDKNVRPSMFHGATVSQAEANELRKITNVIRKGRVKRIEMNEIRFADDSIELSGDTLFIDCSARAVPVSETYPVFEGNNICVQTVRSYQPVFSAGFIAHIEANYEDEATKNDICGLVPLPNHDVDWLIGMAAQMRNQQRWSQEPGLREWLIESRLDGFTALTIPNENTPAEHLKVLMGMKEAVPAAAEGLKRLMPEAIATRAKLGV
ncbi:MAG: NAD(P)-binding protein [Gammaproteobacteria bacterium]|nr:NAD(P)-binding protein [Gammaproteobacteria bacterium]